MDPGAAAARTALDRANAVYLPNRSHAARVAIKKLRYGIEIAEETGVWRPRHLRRDLHRVQALLGDIHDSEVLADRLAQVGTRAASRWRAAEWLLDLVRADIEAQHVRFLQRLPRLYDAIEACERWAGRDRSWGRRLAGAFPVMAASAILVPPLIGAFEQRSNRRPGVHEPPDCVAPLMPAM